MSIRHTNDCPVLQGSTYVCDCALAEIERLRAVNADLLAALKSGRAALFLAVVAGTRDLYDTRKEAEAGAVHHETICEMDAAIARAEEQSKC